MLLLVQSTGTMSQEEMTSCLLFVLWRLHSNAVSCQFYGLFTADTSHWMWLWAWALYIIQTQRKLIGSTRIWETMSTIPVRILIKDPWFLASLMRDVHIEEMINLYSSQTCTHIHATSIQALSKSPRKINSRFSTTSISVSRCIGLLLSSECIIPSSLTVLKSWRFFQDWNNF